MQVEGPVGLRGRELGDRLLLGQPLGGGELLEGVGELVACVKRGLDGGLIMKASTDAGHVGDDVDVQSSKLSRGRFRSASTSAVP